MDTWLDGTAPLGAVFPLESDMNCTVYAVYQVEKCDDSDEVKTLGFYSTAEQARACVEKALSLPGFSSPSKRFSVERIELDCFRAWEEGFFDPH